MPRLGGLSCPILQGEEVLLSLVIDADNDEYAELGVVPPDLLIDAVNIDVREGELVKVLFLPLVKLRPPLGFER